MERKNITVFLFFLKRKFTNWDLGGFQQRKAEDILLRKFQTFMRKRKRYDTLLP
jgi:hypothetical protein